MTWKPAILHPSKVQQEFQRLTAAFDAIDDSIATLENAGNGIYIGSAQVTADQTAIGAGEEDLTDLTVTTATLEAGRRLKITGFANLAAVSATSAILEIKEGTTILAQAHHTLPALHLRGVYVCAIVSPSAAAHTYKLTASSSATDMVMDAGTDHPAFILVEDITADPPAVEGAWAAYTPAWTSDGTPPALGDGTLVGAYRLDGTTLHVRATLTIGSTTTNGTGFYRISTPSGLVTKTGTLQIGSALFSDASSGVVIRGVSMFNGGFSGASFQAEDDSTGEVTNAIPFTWDDNDQIYMQATIEID